MLLSLYIFIYPLLSLTAFGSNNTIKGSFNTTVTSIISQSAIATAVPLASTIYIQPCKSCTAIQSFPTSISQSSLITISSDPYFSFSYNAKYISPSPNYSPMSYLSSATLTLTPTPTSTQEQQVIARTIYDQEDYKIGVYIGSGVLLLLIIVIVFLMTKRYLYTPTINVINPFTKPYDFIIENGIKYYYDKPGGMLLAEGWKKFNDGTNVWYSNGLRSSWEPVYRR
jgi:hypothetical protein